MIGFLLTALIAHVAHAAPNLETFRLQDCNVAGSCFEVVGPSASISHTMTAVSAANVDLLLSVKNKTERVACDSFRYDLKTLFLMCDNSAKHKESISISGAFEVSRYPALTSSRESVEASAHPSANL